MSRHNTEPDKLGNYPTHLTCLGKNLATSHAILEELCSSGFDPGLPTADEDAITPLMLAARNGKQKHFQILVNHGANIRAKDPLGWEAAHYAAANGHTLIIEQLLDFDIDWNLCMNNGGFNILHIAIKNDHYGLMAFILQRSLVDVLDYEGASGKSPLGFAIELGRIKSVQIILKVSSTNVNAFVARGNVRPIHLAAASGNLDVVRELLKYNCILLPNSSGMTPQLIALECGWKDVLRIIEEYDAQKSELPTPKVLTTTISRLSLTKCHQTETGAITDQGALSINNQRLDMKVDVVTSSNSRDLQYAIEAGNLKLCKGLMEAGFNIHCTFKCGCTPLLVALTANKGEIARFLLQQGCSVQGVVPINCPMPGYSVVHLASIKSENVDFLKLLLGKHPSTISPAFQVPISPLHVAVGFKNTEALRVLLNHLNIQCLSNLRGNLDYRNSVTYLSGSEEMHENQDILGLQMPNSLLVFDPQIKRSEVEKFGGSEMPPFWCSGTPLHFAMYVDNFDAAKVLLRYGASANSINELGETPLHLVRKSGSLSIVRLLLDRGANPLSRDYEGRTPAMAAAAHSHVVPLKLILDRHKDFKSADNFGWTLLHHAVRGGPKVFAFLLMQGCCPYSQNYLFNSPAILALWNYNNFSGFPALIFNLDLDYSKLKKALSQTKRTWINSDKSTVRRFLKRAPADAVRSELMAITWRNGSILGDAVEDGEESIVKLFVEAGADLELDRGLHGTPLLTACAFGRLLVVKYLVRAGAKIFSTKGGKPCSAVEAAGSFPEIIRWLLVERYTEQLRLELFTDGTEEVETCAWSGIHCVKVEAVGLYIQSAKDSIFDRAKRLAKLKRDLRGKVVNIFDSVD